MHIISIALQFILLIEKETGVVYKHRLPHGFSFSKFTLPIEQLPDEAGVTDKVLIAETTCKKVRKGR